MDLSKYSDIELLIALVMGEAEGEPLQGKIAVACVVRNRVNDERWPDTWRGVMMQPNQFSCFLPEYFRADIFKQDRLNPVWREAHLAAFGVYNRYIRAEARGANHYYATIIEEPYWAKGRNPVLEVGKHKFYQL